MKQHAELALQKTTNLKPPVFDFGGHRRKNELGSDMDLTVDGKNNVTGKYVSAVSGNGGPTASTDLRGTVTGDLIAFTVNWGSAITKWAGHGVFDSGNQPQILTLWHLVVSIADETNPQKQWETVMAGADSFSR
jgi:avidin family protein